MMTHSNDEIDLLQLLTDMGQHKRLMAVTFVLIAALALAYALLAPDRYQARAAIMPPQPRPGAGALLFQMAKDPVTPDTMLGLKNPNDLYVGMLNSQSVARRLVQRFDLRKHYNVKLESQAMRRMLNSAEIKASNDGLIQVWFTDHDPAFAAKVANGFVEELSTVSQLLAQNEAAHRRDFFNGQLNKARAELSGAESAMRELQESTGLLRPDVQADATLAAIAALRAQVATKSVELAGLKRAGTEQNPLVQRARAELNGLRQQLQEMTQVDPERVVLARRRVPALTQAFEGQQRELSQQEAIYQTLMQQYKLARIDEAMAVAPLQVLDVAVPPDAPTAPRRLAVMAVGLVVATLCALFIGCIAALWRRALKQQCGWSAFVATWWPRTGWR